MFPAASCNALNLADHFESALTRVDIIHLRVYYKPVNNIMRDIIHGGNYSWGGNLFTPTTLLTT